MPEKSYEGRPLLDKLGIRPGMRVCVLGLDDGAFINDLSARTGDITLGEPESESDAVFLAAEGPDDMRRLARLRTGIKPNGAVWAVFRKGRKDFNENDVLSLGLEIGPCRREGRPLLGHPHRSKVRNPEGGPLTVPVRTY